MVCLTPTRVILFTKLIKGVKVIISSLDFFFFSYFNGVHADRFTG